MCRRGQRAGAETPDPTARRSSTWWAPSRHPPSRPPSRTTPRKPQRCRLSPRRLPRGQGDRRPGRRRQRHRGGNRGGGRVRCVRHEVTTKSGITDVPSTQAAASSRSRSRRSGGLEQRQRIRRRRTRRSIQELPSRGRPEDTGILGHRPPAPHPSPGRSGPTSTAAGDAGSSRIGRTPDAVAAGCSRSQPRATWTPLRRAGRRSEPSAPSGSRCGRGWRLVGDKLAEGKPTSTGAGVDVLDHVVEAAPRRGRPRSTAAPLSRVSANSLSVPKKAPGRRRRRRGRSPASSVRSRRTHSRCAAIGTSPPN